MKRAILAVVLLSMSHATAAAAESDSEDPPVVTDAPEDQPAVEDPRVSCIEMKESGGANVANQQGSGAVGVLQFLPTTFYAHAAEMGHFDWSPWEPWQARAVAAYDLSMGRRLQWTVSGCW